MSQDEHTPDPAESDHIDDVVPENPDREYLKALHRKLNHTVERVDELEAAADSHEARIIELEEMVESLVRSRSRVTRQVDEIGDETTDEVVTGERT